MIYTSWGGLNSHNDKIWKEFEDEFVPDSGMADSVAGEIVRAMDRLLYRWFNDGDMVGVGYGNETCNSSNRFLESAVTGWVDLNQFHSGDDKMYEDQLRTNHRIVFEYLMDTGQFTFYKKNTFDSRISSREDLNWERDDYYEEEED